MQDKPLVSAIINNYNYGCFLRDAIDSALNQTYPNVEVIVVDDGSTDNSRDILSSYGLRIIPVLKENGGQASAFNVGFAVSRGEWVLFLDADDILYPEAIETLIALVEPGLSRVCFYLDGVDKDGNELGLRVPPSTLPEGDLWNIVFKCGPASYTSPPTSGNLFRRDALKRVLPMPEDSFRICADAWLFVSTPLFGCIKACRLSLGCYRMHDSNSFYRGDLDLDLLRRELQLYDVCKCTLSEFLRQNGFVAEPNYWMSPFIEFKRLIIMRFEMGIKKKQVLRQTAHTSMLSLRSALGSKKKFLLVVGAIVVAFLPQSMAESAARIAIVPGSRRKWLRCLTT